MATYLADKNATLTIAGATVPVMDGSWDEEIGDDEMTNLKSGGFYEEVMTIKKSTFSGIKVAYDAGAVVSWGVGSSVAASIAISGGTCAWSGTLNIHKVSRKMLNPKGGFTFTFDGVATGSYTTTL